MDFIGRIDVQESLLWYSHIKVPDAIADKIIKNGNKRLIATINNQSFPLALLSSGSFYYLIFSKDKINKLDLWHGAEVNVHLTFDTSKYGMPVPEEMESVLSTDPIAAEYFEQLSPGKQRSLLFIVGKVKNPQLRIDKALIIARFLKDNRGELDYKKLNIAFKNKWM